ncbi:hypothetical protein [Thalassomonas sp. RHCl1]|uniref:hypothetical protein n=1 Tax=Thalassomonas sp. RHCl1 TaxID=2995320 RepID=UPI00248AD436|nr:hypothetical protein [Thalassomonas sp. RHCl1]
MFRLIHKLKLPLALLFTLLTSLPVASAGWVPNVIHFINHSPAIEPREPVIQVPESVVDSSFTINWAMYDGQQYDFLLEYQLAGESDWHILYQGTDTSFNTSSVALAGGDYQIRLSCSEASCPVSGYISDNITLIAKPAMPVVTLSTAVVTINTSFSLNFNQVPQAEYYQLFENELLIDTITGDSLPADGSSVTLDKQLLVAGDYQYSLKGCNQAGCGDLSISAAILAYVPATTPEAPLTTEKAYPINSPLEISWPQVAEGLTLQYFYSDGLSPDATMVDIHQVGKEITAETVLSFAQTGYAWLFVKVCDVLNQCSDYSEATRVQIFTTPVSAPENFSVSLYGQPVNNESKVLSVPLAGSSSPLEEKFVLHWQPSAEVAPSTIGYYKLELDGVSAATIFGTSGYLKTIYPDGWFHREMYLDSQGSYTYTVQACNRNDTAEDCGPKASVKIYADLPVPLTPPPEQALTNVSVSLYQAPVDAAADTISVEIGEQFVLHWGQSDEVEPSPTGSYRISRNGESFGTIWGVSGYLRNFYPDELFHRELSLDTPGIYEFTIAGCNNTGYGIDCGPQSKKITVAVNNTVVPTQAVESFSASLYGEVVNIDSQSILVAKDAKYVLHFQPSEQVSPPNVGSYQLNQNDSSGVLFSVAPYLQLLYPDGWFHYDSSKSVVGNYRYSIQGCNLIGTERECGPVSREVIVGVYDDLSVFSDTAGNLYLFSPQSQGQKLLKLSLLDGVWSLTELAATQWDSLVSGFSLSDYRLEIGLFSGDAVEDIKLDHSDSTKILFLVKNGDGYELKLNLAPEAPAIFEADRSEIRVGETVKLSWQMPADDQQAVSYNLFVEKPDGSARYLFAENISEQSHDYLTTMAGEHSFFVQACDQDNVCGETNSFKVTVIQGVVIKTELLGFPVVNQTN